MVYTRGSHTMACKSNLLAAICLNIVCGCFYATPVVPIFVTEAIGPTKPKLFVIWLFAEISVKRFASFRPMPPAPLASWFKLG